MSVLIEVLDHMTDPLILWQSLKSCDIIVEMDVALVSALGISLGGVDSPRFRSSLGICLFDNSGE